MHLMWHLTCAAQLQIAARELQQLIAEAMFSRSVEGANYQFHVIKGGLNGKLLETVSPFIKFAARPERLGRHTFDSLV